MSQKHPCSLSDAHSRVGSWQGARHVAKDIVGKGIANPMALLLSTSMLLRHLQLHSFSDRCVCNGRHLDDNHETSSFQVNSVMRCAGLSSR